MRRWFRFALVVVVVVILLLGGLLISALGWRTATRAVGPEARPLTDRRFQATPERLERGRYLVGSVAHCFDCHTPVDWSDPANPQPVAGKFGAGTFFDMEGLPGVVYTTNITPDPETGIGRVSDDALARAIREGVGSDGRALFNLMPYEQFHFMSDEDVASIIVYLRSLPSVHNPVPRTELIFPVSLLMRAVPRPLAAPVAPPDFSDPVARGAYLARLGNCRTCHTPVDAQNHALPGMDFSGGFHLKGPWGDVFGANITPDASGIAYYDEAIFLTTIRTGKVNGVRPLNPIMPIGAFRNMTDDDLKAIFACLRTLKPVKHRVDNTEPPAFCRICNQTHGFGDRN
jgi:mono/diheme cytochrome c family protein